MTSIELELPARPSTRSATTTLFVFTGALFLSALLLFSVQPMFTKMVLPRLGGSPSVWSVAMVFFQAMLLAGYLYAHQLTRRVSFKVAIVLHATLLVGALLAMPIAIAHGFDRPPLEGAAPWLIALFAASVGLPFFAVSANGPLLQAWFARSGHPQASDPYFLYGASNLGSFAALIAYPLLMEPILTLHEQSLAWMAGYVGLSAMIGLCAALVLRYAPPRSEPLEPTEAAASLAKGWDGRVRWCALAFLPSALLIAVTAHLATDVASAPFLWVLPLALYLLTFVLAFRERPLLAQATWLRMQPAWIAILAILFVVATGAPLILAVAGHLCAFFVFAMICHSELYRRRPAAADLTSFYTWMSLGGVLGGAFAALIAPHLFVTVLEYPLLVLATLLARPGLFASPRRAWIREAMPILAAGAVVLAPGLFFHAHIAQTEATLFGVAVALLAAIMLLQHARPVRLLALAAVLIAATQIYQPGLGDAVFARSFFGVHKAVLLAEGRFRALVHGTTLHGAERLLDDDGSPASGEPQPLTYYYRGGPLSEGIEAARAKLHGELNRVAIVGLGVGSLACYRHRGEAWRFFEIDPEVVRLATDPALFHFISSCAPQAAIKLGDARLTLADEEPGYDVIVVDAFSSDVVPAHLLTREAIGLYTSKLTAHGSLIFNISNRNVELNSVLAASAEANGLIMVSKRDFASLDSDRTLRTQAEVGILARSVQDTGLEQGKNGWTVARPNGTRVWTDDYSDLASAIWRKFWAGASG
jgi:hypothetical protein